MSQFKNINVVYHYISDLAAARQWYQDVLGWPVAFDSEGWFELGGPNGTHIALNKTSEGDPGKSGGVGTTITFSVDDVDATQAYLQAKGVKCDDVLFVPGMVKLGTFYDPEGNRMHFVDPI